MLKWSESKQGRCDFETFSYLYYWILENDVVDETNQPEDKDKDEEKHRIDHLHEDLAEINLPVSLILAPCLGLGDWSLSESVYVGLHQGVHEGFEETEDQPAVDHLDVGGVGQLGVHTNKELSDLSISLFMFTKIFPW